MKLIELLGSSSAAAIATFFAIAGALYKVIRTSLEFNDEYLSKRKLKRLSYLLTEASEYEELTMLVKAEKREVIFRAIFGRSAAPATQAAIFLLHSEGKVSINDLRSIAYFWNVKSDNTIDVDPGLLGTVQIWLSVFGISIISLYCISLFIKLPSHFGAKHIVFIIAVVLGLLVTASLFFKDIKNVIIARRISARIKRKNNESPNS